MNQGHCELRGRAGTVDGWGDDTLNIGAQQPSESPVPPVPPLTDTRQIAW